jgi:hypothetical protein
MKMSKNHNLWTFKTARFLVTLSWDWEDYPDLSWDDTGETIAKLQSGEWGNYCFCVTVACDGRDISRNYLGNSIYADPTEFRDHIGAQGKYGSYFKDMVRQGIDETRKALCSVPRLRCI